MVATFLTTSLTVPQLAQLLPSVRVFVPSAAGLPGGPPYLVRIEASWDYGFAASEILNLAAQGYDIALLPHPRDTKPIPAKSRSHLARLTPNLNTASTMKDLLTAVYAACPSTAWDPSLHCF